MQQPEWGWRYKSPEKQNKLKKINIEDNSDQYENYINESQVDNVSSEYTFEVGVNSWMDYVKTLKEEDIESLGPGKWLSDGIINVMLKKIMQDALKMDKIVLSLSPSEVQIIRAGKVHETAGVSIETIINTQHLDEYQIILFPVNNNENLYAIGGSHWSLLIYVKGHKKFYHYDSSGVNINDIYAVQIRDNLAKANSCFNADLHVQQSPVQNDGFSCGIYVIMNATTIVRDIKLDEDTMPNI